MYSLANKVAVVTGGASGIGAAIATQFLKAGATVYSTDLAEFSPVGVKALMGDVSKEADILRLLGEVATIDRHINILVICFWFPVIG